MRKFKKIEPWLAEEAGKLYSTGKYSIFEIGQELGYSAGTIYNVLRDSGCKFIKKWKHPASEEFRRKLSLSNKGKKLTEAQRRAISERKSCNYNGMNGYGHTKLNKNGYIIVYAPKHPNAHKDGYVLLHRVLMEQHIGRYLASDEVVHHINHVRNDNRIENLLLMTNHDHMSMHMKERYAKRRNDLSTVS